MLQCGRDLVVAVGFRCYELSNSPVLYASRGGHLDLRRGFAPRHHFPVHGARSRDAGAPCSERDVSGTQRAAVRTGRTRIRTRTGTRNANGNAEQTRNGRGRSASATPQRRGPRSSPWTSIPAPRTDNALATSPGRRSPLPPHRPPRADAKRRARRTHARTHAPHARTPAPRRPAAVG